MDDKKEWGFVQGIKEQVIEPGSIFVAVNEDKPTEAIVPPTEYSSITAAIYSVSN